MSEQSYLGILTVQLSTGGQDRLPIHQPFVKLGRSKSNDVILDDAKVSSQHARIMWGRELWLVEDLGSKNGTYVNGQRLQANKATPLRSADVVQISSFSFQVLAPQPHEPVPPRLGSKVHLEAKPRPGLVVSLRGGVHKFPLGKDTVTLGRSSDSDIKIEDSLVSGHHARLERDRGRGTYRIVDLGSTNGLVFQGQRVPERVLADGDVLYIGRQISLSYRASIGFLRGAVEKRKVAEGPRTQYLDMRALPKTGRRITIGRHSSNVLRLKHPRVSRYHAVIEQFGARFRLQDLDSHAGTFVNGKRVEKEAWIKEGDELKIASFRLVFQEDGITHFDEAGNIRVDALRIEKWYTKTVNILKKVSLSIYPKEFVAIVGESGSGKSTLMNALTGFKPANGEKSRVLVNGENLYTHMDEYRSEMGYVPQDDIIHRELTVYKALDYAAQLRMPADTTKAERHERVMEVIEELGLKRQWENPITALSGGQRKRVSIGVELLTKPGLFFLDEPTSGLDPGTETEMMELLRDLADGGRTVFLITHATKNVMMCDQVVFLAKGGYLAFYGPPNEALEYFERYRTEEERRYKAQIEFDDIYTILETRGRPEEWGARYRKSPLRQKFIIQRLQSLKRQRRTPTPAPARPQRRRRRVSAFRQFMILSSRNLRIMAQDKISLVLMLAVAPLIGVMDFMWGRKLFELEEGDAPLIITMFFMMGLIGILTGALSSVREIVKENDIYLRERTVVLQIVPYIMSKVWVGIILAAYQSAVFVLFKKVFVDPPLPGAEGYLLMYVTVFLCTLSGYMLGLLISAASPNQNVALFLVVIVLVPQFLFAGALLPRNLIPGGDYISAITSTRWAFEGLVKISGIGDDVLADPCWAMPTDKRKALKQEEKEALNCRCMGKQMFDNCRFPGIRNENFYGEKEKAQLEADRPAEPPTPVPLPTYTPVPTLTPPPKPQSQSEQDAYEKKREKQGDKYQKQREKQGEEYRLETEDQWDGYRKGSTQWGENLKEWEMDRQTAVKGAEGYIESTLDRYQHALNGDVPTSWISLSIISVVVLVLAMVFQKRKDVI